MALEDKYSKLYASSQLKEQLSEIVVHKWPKNRAEAIVAMGGGGESILDIGCGNGFLLYQFRHSFSRLIGLEYSTQRLSQAKANLADYNFIPILGSAEEMSQIETSSVDRIISADTIEHIPDVYSAVKELYRVLKTNGILVINTPNIAFIKKRIVLCLGRFPSTSQPNEGLGNYEGTGNDILFDGGHLHYFTYRALRIILEKAGFKMVKKIGYGKWGWIHNIRPSLLSVGVQWVAKK
jgi:SAM-dependent methyltransferase